MAIINFSHVIMVLLDVARGKPRHIPYRDSRLTFLLQVDNGSMSNPLSFLLLMLFLTSPNK